MAARKNNLPVDPKTIALTALNLSQYHLLPAAILCIWTADNSVLTRLKEEIEQAIEENNISIPF